MTEEQAYPVKKEPRQEIAGAVPPPPQQQFAPKGANPNNEGTVSEILEDGLLMIEFPIGDDDPKEHSQVAPYPASICHKI